MRIIRSLFVQPVRRLSVSWLLIGTATALAVAYAIPGLGVSTALTPGFRSVVAFLNALGPVWSVSFGTVSAVLLGGVLARSNRAMVVGHILGVAVCSGWATALIVGALTSRPTGSIVTAVVAVALAVLHVWAVVDYAADKAAGGEE